ncbi:HlyD family secretion protein [Sphingomonas oligophenolica]|uniref:HlyD family efflux transporter periplasmic adaptor subunit n=1 Tax=Sphingomonas oligophenolica TaxID=301154 RepID=A0A502CBA1_9SPHN|nr:HlyD family efflux transporter periplasmic adaptor subunit [Sphingomonas oligophenolica]TPG09970.1 HlyD family efflux transporter periplasmic adaptor subunit [Sphingomonas oligophenolica]
MTETLFRLEAIEAKRQRLTGTVIAATPPQSQLYTAMIGGVVLVMIAFLAFGSYASSATARGVVAVDKGITRVFPASAGEVRQIVVAVGDRVVAGQPLVALSMAQGKGGLSRQIAEIDRQLAEIDSQLGIAQSTGSVGTAGLARQRAGLEDTIQSLERQIAIGRSQIALAGSTVARRERLSKQGAGSQAQVDDAQRDALTRRADVEALEERLSVARNSVAALSIQSSQVALDASKARSLLQAQRAALTAQRADLQRQDHLVVSAPISGRIGDIAVELGQRATSAQSLVTIVPSDSKLEVRLFAPSSAIGFVRRGQRVRLRFDAFPYRKYGWAEGAVTEISRVAVDAPTVDTTKPVEPVFRVRVRVDTLRGMKVDDAALRPGMTLTADLFQQRRPLWALIVGPISGSVAL